MLSPRWRKVLRDLWLHKPRTMLVVLAIAVGIIGTGSVLNTWSMIRRATRDEFRDSNPASATLRIDSVDAALLSQVRALPAIADAEARRTVIGVVRAAGASRTAVLFALGDPTAIHIGKVRPESGAWPPSDGSIVIEKSSVQFAGIAVGDSVTVQVGDASPQRLDVTGIAQDVGVAPGWMEHVVYGFVTPATLARLGAPSSLNEVRIAVRDARLSRSDVRRIAYQVSTVVERTGHAVTSVTVPVPGRHVHAGQIDSLLYTQGAFGVLALVLSGFLVVNLIAAMLAGQVREIAVMKTLGARAGQIAGMYLGLAFVLGCVACACAVPLAALIGRGYAQFTADLLNFSVEGIAIPGRVIALQLAVGALLPVAAAAIPVTHGCRIPVSAALRDFGIIARIRTPRMRLLSRVSGVSRPLLLSLRNAFRRRQRMVLTLLTLGTGGAVYLGAINLRASVVRSVDLLYQGQRYDMALRFATSWPVDSIERAASGVAGVARAEAWSVGHGAVAGLDGTMGNTFPITAPPSGSLMLLPAVVEGRWLRAGDRNAMVVNRRLLQDEPTATVGRGITLIVGGRLTHWTVVGVVESDPSPGAFASRETLAPLVDGGRVDRLVISTTLRGPAAQSELLQRVRGDLAQRGYAVEAGSLVQQNRTVIEDHLLMVAGFLGIMAQLIIVVGGLGLAATMSLAVLERTREIGVLRAIGAPHRAILTMVHVEGLVIAVISWIVAIPLSIPMSVVLARAFSRIMLPVPVTYAPETVGVLRWLGVVLVVSLAASAWPARRATRIPTAAALAYE